MKDIDLTNEQDFSTGDAASPAYVLSETTRTQPVYGEQDRVHDGIRKTIITSLLWLVSVVSVVAIILDANGITLKQTSPILSSLLGVFGTSIGFYFAGQK